MIYPEVLLSPLTMQEAVLSSRIEGTQADLTEVLGFEAGKEVTDEPRREDIREIINYRCAMNAAVKEMEQRPLSLNLLRRLHFILFDSVRGHNKERGDFRKVQNWIGAEGSKMEDAYFIPPDPLHLEEYLDNFEKYIHADELDPLVQLAVVHAQFEIIHPFMDGNGRLGRMLVPLFLYQKRILSRPTFYLSSYLERHQEAYIGGLRDIEEPRGWNRWVLFFLKALTEQAEEDLEKARAIFELYEELKKQVLNLTHSQYAIPLLDAMFSRPIFRINDLLRMGTFPSEPSRQTVVGLIGKLAENKVLRVLQKGGGRRARRFSLQELIDICEGKR